VLLVQLALLVQPVLLQALPVRRVQLQVQVRRLLVLVPLLPALQPLVLARLLLEQQPLVLVQLLQEQRPLAQQPPVRLLLEPRQLVRLLLVQPQVRQLLALLQRVQPLLAQPLWVLQLLPLAE
jgi:hypothetical protein